MSNREKAAYKFQESEEYLARIKTYYAQMSESEKKIADYFLDEKYEKKDLSINQLSKQIGTSVATIVRFCHTLKFQGYAEFKFYMNKGIMAPLYGNVELNSGDNTRTLKKKVSELAKNTIERTTMTIDDDELEKAIEVLSGARQILVCGEGSAFGIAHVAANTFLSLGFSSIVVSDPLMQLRSASLLKEGDVALGISNCGYIKDVIDTLKIAKEAGASTICVTGMADSLITKYSDIVLQTALRDNQNPLDLPAVTISHMIAIHTLSVGMLVRGGKDLSNHVKGTHKISDLKRYQMDMEEISNGRVKF